MTKESGDQQLVQQHSVPTAPAVVMVHGPRGHPMGGATVHFSAPPQASYVRPSDAVTDADGRAAWQGYLHTAGAQTLQAQMDDGSEPVTFTFQVQPARQAFDGEYRTAGSTAFDPCFDTFRIVGDEVHYDSNVASGCTQRAASISQTSGDFSLRLSLSLRRDREYAGRFVLDARGQVGAALTVTQYWSAPSQPPVIIGNVDIERW